MPDSSKTIQKKHDDLFFNSFKLLTVVLIVIGILIRLINLDEKITWADETFTYLRIYGYTKSDLMQEVVNSQILTAGTLLEKYQSPRVGKSIIDTVKGLALEDPKHPPLYFVMTNLWVQCFGSTVAATRSFSAFINLLVFPALYWLCQELFQSKIVGLVAIAIIAVSPFHLVYAQEARMYSFSTLNILLSSAALLRAIRLHTKSSWSIYSVTLLIGLYTNLLFSLVAIGQGIYVAINQGLRSRKILIAYLSALLAFLPWLFLIITQSDKVQETIKWSKLIVLRNSLFRPFAIKLSPTLEVGFLPTLRYKDFFSTRCYRERATCGRSFEHEAFLINTTPINSHIQHISGKWSTWVGAQYVVPLRLCLPAYL
ncbi:MAG: glycosyltransferase family 39 protein [Nostoc indistinguendum CM1-VF10]|jgi:uncharacterized membrane protein|nr:glycosyltransferase family 39 protein [Nostoc indistinguendum CM1-VF10]